MFDNVAIVAPNQPIDLNDAKYRNMSQGDKEQLSLAEQMLPPNDSQYYRSETAKMMMMVGAFNDNCAYKFDVLVTEFEFWNPGVDDCTGQNLTKDQKYVNYQNMIADMDVIRDNYNASHTHQIYVETYLGYINQNTSYTHQQIANWVDGMTTNGKRRVDRVLLH
jgi:hypothetical protein